MVSAEFVQRFRLRAATAEHLLLRIGNRLAPATRRNCALAPKEQLLTALRFYATNSFYHVLRDAHGPSAASVCRVVRKVSRAINEELFQELVCWPQDSVQFSQDFFAMAGMPSVCGIVDGTLVGIATPSVNEQQYVDRKGNHSLNVMLVAGPQHQFVACNASWPGSVNDARVLRNSRLYNAFELDGYRPFPGAVILGDSIYPCMDWLIPPVLGDNLPPATRAFNKSLKVTRSLVERSIGLLKLRFPSLRKLRVSRPELAAEIVKSCVVLHNLCIGIEGPEEDAGLVGQDMGIVEDVGQVPAVQHNAHGIRRRDMLVAQFAGAVN